MGRDDCAREGLPAAQHSVWIVPAAEKPCYSCRQIRESTTLEVAFGKILGLMQLEVLSILRRAIWMIADLPGNKKSQ